MRLRVAAVASLLLLAVPGPAVEMSTAAKQAFQDYAAAVERRLAQQHASPETYLAVLNRGAVEPAEVERKLKSGQQVIEPVNGGMREVSGGLIHHWRGAAFVPGAKAQDMLKLLRDYNHLATYYAPEVVSSHALRDNGDSATVAVRLKKQKVVTVVLDAEYDVHTGLTTPTSGYGYSRGMHIWQVDDVGTAREHRLAEGNDDGFLWRMNSYWSFIEVPGGLLIECEAISLTRDIPAGLSWMITPVIRDLPRDSLRSTLNATKTALERRRG